MGNVRKIKEVQEYQRGEMSAFVKETLSKVALGMTRHELINHRKLPVNKIYKKSGLKTDTTRLDGVLCGLVRYRKIRITGFRSGAKNGIGGAIYQLV